MPAYKDKGSSTWYAMFFYTDWTGKRHRKKKRGFKLKKDALDYEREFLNKHSRSCDMAFSSMVELYMEDMRSRLRRSTMKNKEYVIEKKIVPFFGKLALNEITAAHVRKWQNGLLDDPADYSPTYLKTINNQLSAIFNYAVKFYSLPENPVRRAGSIGKKKAATMQFWTLEEFNTFLPAVSDKPDSRVLFLILFYTGMRIGEALALTPLDVDFEAKTIQVDESYQRIDREDVLDDPKTPKSNRVITVPAFLCEEIEAYMAMLYECEDDERLFDFTQSFAQKEMERGCSASGAKKIRVHDLRHSHASLLIDMGFHIKLIAERLGHENIQTTLETYGHLYPNKHSQVAEKLEELQKVSQKCPSDEKKAPETT